MPLFADTTLTHLENIGENAFASERPCIVDRTSLAIVSGTDVYTLPSYVINIRRITYKGWKVFPITHRDLRQSYQSGNQAGRPYWYIFNNVGQSQIKLMPVPTENISAEATYTNLWGPTINTKFIIEFYRLPDVSDLQNKYLIPNFIRRRLLKTFVLSRAFQMEGRGVNIKASKYWRARYDFLKSIYIDLLDDLNNKPRNIICNNITSHPYGQGPPAPQLPVSKYGISVDEITG